MDRFDKIALAIFIGVVVLPQIYLIVTGPSIEAVAGRMAFAVIPLMFICFWAIGLLGRTIERIIKGRG